MSKKPIFRYLTLYYMGNFDIESKVLGLAWTLGHDETMFNHFKSLGIASVKSGIGPFLDTRLYAWTVTD
jgi:hypothetical protein